MKGLGSNLLRAVEGTIDAVAHLPTTLTSLADLTTTAGSTIAGASLARQARQQAQSFKAGNAETKAVMLGAGFGEILQLFGGEVAKAGKLRKLSKVAEVGKGGKPLRGELQIQEPWVYRENKL